MSILPRHCPKHLNRKANSRYLPITELAVLHGMRKKERSTYLQDELNGINQKYQGRSFRGNLRKTGQALFIIEVENHKKRIGKELGKSLA